MATIKTFKKFTETGSSEAEAFHLTIKQFNDMAKKKGKVAAKDIGKVLETIPLKYLKLLAQEKDYLITIINLELLKANSDNDEPNSIANIVHLQAIKNIFTEDTLDQSDISSAILKMNILEANWNNSGSVSKKQAALINKSKAILSKITKLRDNSATFKELPELLSLADRDLSLEIKLVKESFVSFNKGKGNISIQLNPKSLNEYKGTLSKSIVNMVEKELRNKFNPKDILNLQHLGFSPSFVEDVETTLTTAILGKKGRNLNRKNISKTEIKQARSAKIKAAKSKVKNKILPKLPTIKDIEKGADLPLFSIMNLINQALSEQIKDNMGDSSDPPVLLRNQTGRFSESARLLSLTRSSAGAILGTYTYQRNPYDVFLPGRKLGTTKRNPKVYIEGSIRELAIAIMKRKFPGLALELV